MFLQLKSRFHKFWIYAKSLCMQKIYEITFQNFQLMLLNRLTCGKFIIVIVAGCVYINATFVQPLNGEFMWKSGLSALSLINTSFSLCKVQAIQTLLNIYYHFSRQITILMRSLKFKVILRLKAFSSRWRASFSKWKQTAIIKTESNCLLPLFLCKQFIKAP